MTTRIYPLRFTRDFWKIPLHCVHKCGNYCKKILVKHEDDPSILVLEDNPHYVDGKCNKMESLERTHIKLSSFDIENPMGHVGTLHNPEMIVIPQRSFSLYIDYPLSKPETVEVKSQHRRGFQLKEVIHIIKTIYAYIYDREVITAEPQTYNIRKPCINCINVDLKKNLEDIEISEVREEMCSICHCECDGDEQLSKLPCGHIFHKECIHKWIDVGGDTTSCPLCRNVINCCEKCNGSGWNIFDYIGVVIPLEYRGAILNRNRTEGEYGIYAHDLEDLVLEEIHYDKTDRKMYIKVRGTCNIPTGDIENLQIEGVPRNGRVSLNIE